MSIVLKNQALMAGSDLVIELYRFLKIHIFCYYYFPHFKDSVPCRKFKIDPNNSKVFNLLKWKMNCIFTIHDYSVALERLRRITQIFAKSYLAKSNKITITIIANYCPKNSTVLLISNGNSVRERIF